MTALFTREAQARTTTDFKVGDKVHVVPAWPTTIEHCIRAVVTDVTSDYGYHLKAFLQDLPGVWMYNIWDKDLVPRVDRKRVPTPPERLIRERP